MGDIESKVLAELSKNTEKILKDNGSVARDAYVQGLSDCLEMVNAIYALKHNKINAPTELPTN